MGVSNSDSADRRDWDETALPSAFYAGETTSTCRFPQLFILLQMVFASIMALIVGTSRMSSAGAVTVFMADSGLVLALIRATDAGLGLFSTPWCTLSKFLILISSCLVHLLVRKRATDHYGNPHSLSTPGPEYRMDQAGPFSAGSPPLLPDGHRCHWSYTTPAS